MKVNLDALIKREDFDGEYSIKGDNELGDKLILQQLKLLIRSDKPLLCKPDFQRETDSWSPKTVSLFIKSFYDGDLIPAIILWKSPANVTFVIDGGHRISALLAWMLDDYGDGHKSKEFFGNELPIDQINSADRTRRMVEDNVGNYENLMQQLKSSDEYSSADIDVSRLLLKGLHVQWIKGNAKNAQESFFKINQSSVSLNKTEQSLIENRLRPIGLAARSIIRGGRGHKYWLHFKPHVREKIENYGKIINNVLFLPYHKGVIDTFDLPIGGKAMASGTPLLVFEMLSIINSGFENNPEDPDGSGTIQVLDNCYNTLQWIHGKENSSLGLHPIPYFYSLDGNFKSVSFNSTIKLIMEFQKNNILLNKFIKCRSKFEECLINHNYLTSHILRQYRTGEKAIVHIVHFYQLLINSLSDGNSIDDSIEHIIKENGYTYLNTRNTSDNIGPFSQKVKSAKFIQETLETELKCKICGGYLPRTSISHDHITRRSEGGSNTVENDQLTHPYCNAIVKH